MSSPTAPWSIVLTAADPVLFAAGDFVRGMVLNELEFGEGQFIPMKSYPCLGDG